MIEIFSLIDITKTNIHRNDIQGKTTLTKDEWNFQRNQQRNWDTVVQLLGLRCQPFDITDPVKLINQRPAAFGFGWEYGPANNVTIWRCTCRYEMDADLWMIRTDFDNIPVIAGLEESIEMPHACFSSINEPLNIILRKI